jgi:hypothetical protein
MCSASEAGPRVTDAIVPECHLDLLLVLASREKLILDAGLASSNICIRKEYEGLCSHYDLSTRPICF